MVEPNKHPVIASWDDLESIKGAGSRAVLLPETSAAAGREIFVKVREIKPLELVRIINFPMDEINAKIQANASADEFAKAFAEHVSVMTAEDLMSILESTIRVGLVEPDPKSGDIQKLSPDWMTIFREIVALTMPAEGMDAAARFR
jgi:hypothetical protein